MSVQFVPQLLRVDIPQSDEAILTACSQQRVGLARAVGPLDCLDGAVELVQEIYRRTSLRLPQADEVVTRGRSQDLATGVPLDLLNLSLMTARPHLLGQKRRFDVPQEDVLALACDSEALLILPVDLDALQTGIALLMREFSHILTITSSPHSHDSGVAASGDQRLVIRLGSLVELAIHEHHTEALDVFNVDMTTAFLVLPDAGHFVTAARHQMGAVATPVH